jgi:hypothetical protein
MKEAKVQIKNRQRLLIIATIAAVGLFVGDKVILSPMTAAWSARARQITELRKQVAQGKLLLQRERSIRNRWAEMQQRTLTNNLSAAEQRLWRVIDSCAQDTRVTINAITPQWKRDSDDYITYECRIDAAGDLDRLSRFLYRIEREPVALKLESVELGARDKEGQQLSLGLQISGLVLNPPPK